MSEGLNHSLPGLADLFAGRAAAAGATGATSATTDGTRNESSTAFTALLAGQLRPRSAESSAADAADLATADAQQPILATPFWSGPGTGIDWTSMTGHTERMAVHNRLVHALADGRLASEADGSRWSGALAASFQELPGKPGTVIQGPGTGQAPAAAIPGGDAGAGKAPPPSLLASLEAQATQNEPLADEMLNPVQRVLARSAAAAAGLETAAQALTREARSAAAGSAGEASPLGEARRGSLSALGPTDNGSAAAAAKTRDGLALVAGTNVAGQPMFATAALSAATVIPDSIAGLRRSAADSTASPPPAPASSVNLAATAGPVAQTPLDLTTVVSGDRPAVQTPPAMQVADQVKVMIQGEQREAQLQLHPRELGAVNIRIALHADQASVSIEASNPELYRELSSALPRLRQLFMEEGMGMAQLALDMGQSQQQDREALAQAEPTHGPRSLEQSTSLLEATGPLPAARRLAEGHSLDLYA